VTRAQVIDQVQAVMDGAFTGAERSRSASSEDVQALAIQIFRELDGICADLEAVEDDSRDENGYGHGV
jgi:hypothetical protein